MTDVTGGGRGCIPKVFPLYQPEFLLCTELGIFQSDVFQTTSTPPPSFLQDNVLVLAATHRYKEKYVTTLLYKPVTL